MIMAHSQTCAEFSGSSRPGRFLTVLTGVAALALAGLVQPSHAGTLDQIKQAGKITLGYREDAKPFSSKDASGNPAGFTVMLCNAVVEHLKSSLQLPGLATNWVPVKLDEETAAIGQGKIHRDDRQPGCRLVLHPDLRGRNWRPRQGGLAHGAA